MKMLFFVFSLIWAVTGYAQDAAEIIEQIRTEYNQRFDAEGNYIDDSRITKEFIVSQNTAISKLRANGNIQKSIRITNDSMPDLIITVSIIQNNSGLLSGLLIERSEYVNRTEESHLRIFGLSAIMNGRSIVSFNGTGLVKIKSEHLTEEGGGRIIVTYPTNYKNNTFDQLVFDIQKNIKSELSFFTSSGAEFSEVYVDIWVKLLSANFGVKRISQR